MKYVYSEGSVFRLSERNYRKLLQAIAEDKDDVPGVPTLGRKVCNVDLLSPYDLDADGARMALEDLEAE